MSDLSKRDDAPDQIFVSQGDDGWRWPRASKFPEQGDRENIKYVRADRIEELVEERDLWKSRYEHHNHERLETLKLNAMQASKIGSLMNTIAKLEKKISKLEKTE